MKNRDLMLQVLQMIPKKYTRYQTNGIDPAVPDFLASAGYQHLGLDVCATKGFAKKILVGDKCE